MDFIRFITVLEITMHNIILPDIVAVGIYNSDVAVKNKEITKNRKTSMFEIELPIESGGLSYINNEISPIEPSMIICAKPGQIRHTRLPFKCYYIHMIVTEGELYERLMSLPSFIHTPATDKYKELFMRLCTYYDTALRDDRIMMQSIVLELIFTLCKHTEGHRHHINTKSNSYLIIEKAMEYIKENLTSELSLEAVSEQMSFSPIHFLNIFI